MISYEGFHHPESTNVSSSKDEMVLVANKDHPTIKDPLLKHDVYNKQHAVVSPDRFASSSQPWYSTVDKQASIVCQGMAVVSILSVMSQTHLVAITPCWPAEEFAEPLELQVLPLPLKQNNRTCYFSRHEAAEHDKGHQ